MYILCFYLLLLLTSTMIFCHSKILNPQLKKLRKMLIISHREPKCRYSAHSLFSSIHMGMQMHSVAVCVASSWYSLLLGNFTHQDQTTTTLGISYTYCTGALVIYYHYSPPTLTKYIGGSTYSHELEAPAIFFHIAFNLRDILLEVSNAPCATTTFYPDPSFCISSWLSPNIILK